MLMHGMVPIKSSARCWKNNDACWYAIYLSATCKCWEISVCVCVYSICMFRLFSCTCDSISHSKIVSPNHFLPTYKNRSLDAGCVQWSSRWTLIRQFNFYLFSFNWIALINVSSAFIDENEKKESEALILFLPLTLPSHRSFFAFKLEVCLPFFCLLLFASSSKQSWHWRGQKIEWDQYKSTTSL